MEKTPQSTVAQAPSQLSSKFNGFMQSRPMSHLQVYLRSPGKIWPLIALVSIGFLVLGHRAENRFGLLIGFLCAVLLNAIVLFYMDLCLASRFPDRQLEGRDAWGLLDTVRELASRLDFKMPKLVLIEATTPYAFSIGVISTQSTIAISTGLLKRLTSEEIRAILAYELIRLKTKKTRSATAAAAIGSLVMTIATKVDSILTFRFLSKKRSQDFLIGPFTALMSPLISGLVRLAVHPKDVLATDLETAQFISDPTALASAIWKLDAYSKTQPFSVNLGEAHLFAVSPLARYRGLKFLAPQPPAEERLRQLVGRFPA